MTVLRNEYNQGYGGNQKIGYRFAIERGLRLRRAAPRRRPVRAGGAAAPGRAAARRRGRRGVRLPHDEPVRRAAGRHAALQVRRQPDPDLVAEPLLGTQLTEFHSGYRVYSVAALQQISVRAELERLPLRHRDHHPAAQRRAAHRRAADPDLLRRRDLPRQRDEVREGRDARDAAQRRAPRGPPLPAALRAASGAQDNAHYDLKLGYPSSHQFAARRGARRARAVLDIGAGPGGIARELREEGLPGGGRRSVRRPGTADRASTSSRRTSTTSSALRRPRRTTTCCCSTSSST